MSVMATICLSARMFGPVIAHMFETVAARQPQPAARE
jgi:hypothetical protein